MVGCSRSLVCSYVVLLSAVASLVRKSKFSELHSVCHGYSDFCHWESSS